MHLHLTIARAGTFVFTVLLTITMLTAERTPANAATSSAGPATRPAVTTIPTSTTTDTLAVPTLSAPEAAVPAVPVGPAVPVVLGVETAAEPAPVATATPPPVISYGSLVLASWYGPGFYGNRTACGQIYSSQIMGVAHRTLPCGTLLVLGYGGRTVTVPVIDRGPYIAGRTLDLSAATKGALGCPDLCTLLMQFAR